MRGKQYNFVLIITRVKKSVIGDNLVFKDYFFFKIGFLQFEIYHRHDDSIVILPQFSYDGSEIC